MSFEALTQPFMQADLFAELSSLQIKTLMICAEQVSFREGDTIIRADEAGDCAYLVMAGETRIIDAETGRPGDRRFGAGTLVGEMAMLIEIEHETTVVAARGVEALRFSRETLRELMQLDKSLAEALLSRMSARLGSLGKRLRAFDETLEQTTRLSAMASMGMHPAPVTYN